MARFSRCRAATCFRVEPARLIRHSDWLRSSARLAVRQGNAQGWHRSLTAKTLAKATAWLVHLRSASDCLLAVAERPGS